MEKYFIESTPFNSNKIDRTNNKIHGVAILNPTSRNNRTYTNEALRSILPFVNGCKSFIDHASDPFGGQSVLKLLGSFSNARIDGSTVRADLHVLASAQGKDLIFELAERSPHSVGFSISGRAKTDDSGQKEVVHEIISLRSVDLVVEPAATSGLFEATDEINLQQLMRDIAKLKDDLEKIKQRPPSGQRQNGGDFGKPARVPSIVSAICTKEEFWKFLNECG